MLNRASQRDILECLAAEYPQRVALHQRLPNVESLPAQIAYLAEHGLVAPGAVLEPADGPRQYGPVAITAKGIDFLQDDGGLSAVLGVVTVKLHEDTVKSLLLDKVGEAEGPPNVKAQLSATIRALPADATRHLALRLMERGVQSLPSAVDSLRQILGSGL